MSVTVTLDFLWGSCHRTGRFSNAKGKFTIIVTNREWVISHEKPDEHVLSCLVVISSSPLPLHQHNFHCLKMKIVLVQWGRGNGEKPRVWRLACLGTHGNESLCTVWRKAARARFVDATALPTTYINKNREHGSNCLRSPTPQERRGHVWRSRSDYHGNLIVNTDLSVVWIADTQLKCFSRVHKIWEKFTVD